MTKIDTEELYAFNQLLKESKEGLDLKFKQSDLAIADFSKEGKLTGGAWSSAKNHFDKGYTPLINTFDSALVLLVDKFSDYTTEFRQQVTGGYVKLDTDQLEDLEIRMQNLASYKVQWLLDMADQLAGIPGIGKFFDEVSLNSTKKEVILLRKFQEFEHSHRNEFDEIAEALHFLRIGLEAVGNKKNFQGASKGFGPIDFNKDSWASNLSKFNERNKDKIDHIKKFEAAATAAVIEQTAQIQNAQMNMNSMNDAMMAEINRSYSPTYNPLSGKTWFISESGWLVPYGEHYGKVGNKKVLNPNVIYIDPNGYKYTTDSSGRISGTKAGLNLGNGVRNNYAQKTVGGVDRLPTDDGGHLIASQFNGSGQIDNLVPQNSGINRAGGEWFKLEQNWASALKSGSDVKVEIIPNYSANSLRPASFNVQYFIDGEKFSVVIKNP